ncbi:phage major capsid protein [uncultured Gordonia sp.]|uniref:phage major capsid protein n=1 Tax=uncultured Gordonia sp. TaxID=198437 RepID=UPI00258E871E|nr:phage major capsid protein [uncultured Gordonia sp.]
MNLKQLQTHRAQLDRDVLALNLEYQALGKLGATTKAAKKTELDAKAAKLVERDEWLKKEIDLHDRVSASAVKMAGAGDLGYQFELPDAPESVVTRRGLPSPLDLPAREWKAFHESATRKQSWKAEVTTKANPLAVSTLPSPGLPPALQPPIEMLLETTRVSSLLPTRAVSSPVIEFMRFDSMSGYAVVAEGATKPPLSVTNSAQTVSIQKLAATLTVTNEMLADYPVFASFLPGEMTRALYDAESRFLLDGVTSGDVAEGTQATGGMLGASGILTYAVPSSDTAVGSPGLRAVNHSIGALRSGTAYATADSIVMSPNTFTELRGAVDSMGRFILGEPESNGAIPQLWGCRVAVTTQIADGEAFIFDSTKFGEILLRQSVTLELGYNGTDFAQNQATWRCEERLALAVIRPAAGLLLTGIVG